MMSQTCDHYSVLLVKGSPQTDFPGNQMQFSLFQKFYSPHSDPDYWSELILVNEFLLEETGWE
jgi:hypothetical protein